MITDRKNAYWVNEEPPLHGCRFHFAPRDEERRAHESEWKEYRKTKAVGSKNKKKTIAILYWKVLASNPAGGEPKFSPLYDAHRPKALG
jgi:hypothetical protein